MAISFVSGQIGQGFADGATITSTFPHPTTTGNLIIVQAMMYASRPSFNFTITDNSGNTYTKLLTVQDASNNTMEFYYCNGITGSASHTVSMTPGGGFFQIAMMASEWTGVRGSAAIDGTATNGSIANSTAWNGGSVTTQQAGDLVYGGFFGVGFNNGSFGGVTPASGYSVLGSQVSNQNGVQYTAAYQVAGAPNPYNPGITWSNSGHGAACTVAFFAGITSAVATKDHGTGAEGAVVLVLTPKAATDGGTSGAATSTGPITPIKATDSATSAFATQLLQAQPVGAKDGGRGVERFGPISVVSLADHGGASEYPVIKVLSAIMATDQGHGGEQTAIVHKYLVASSAHIILAPTASEMRACYSSAAANMKWHAACSARGGRQAALLDSRYLGRYQVGESVPLHCQCVSVVTEVVPDAPPVASIYNGYAFQSRVLIPKDNTTPTAIGRFRGRFTLTSLHSPGTYTVIYTYGIQGLPRTLYDIFEVVPGGHPSGAVLSLVMADAPADDATLAHLSSGRIQIGINPKLDKGF